MKNTKVIVVMPAHNEEDLIRQSVEALKAQTRPPDEIVVSADNCTDKTELLALKAGAHVLPTRGNTHKRAGAVNYQLRWLLGALDDRDIIIIVDADTKLESTFLENAEKLLRRRYDAIGPVFDAEPTWSLLEQLQHNEYVRYSRMTDRRNGRTLNLSGAAQALRVGTIRAVVEARRRGELPGKPEMYNLDAISEDMELTIAVKLLGFRTIASKKCRCVTDMMKTPQTLWTQRIRWVQGGMVELKRYGRNKVTAPMIRRQWASVANVLFTAAWVSYSAALTYQVGWQRFNLTDQPFWLGVILFFSAERAFTARKAGWRGALVGAMLLPEMFYDMFRQTVFVTSLVRHLRGVEIEW
jgi:cellulose synthase/poly-beta-1,6-N-acetylglucosamine synthase-like glycosyltransferase